MTNWGKSVCLICVEFNKKKMTIDEVKRALPEMVMFASTEEEKAHYKKLQTLTTPEELESETQRYSSKTTNK